MSELSQELKDELKAILEHALSRSSGMNTGSEYEVQLLTDDLEDFIETNFQTKEGMVIEAENDEDEGLWVVSTRQPYWEDKATISFVESEEEAIAFGENWASSDEANLGYTKVQYGQLKPYTPESKN